MQLNFGRQKPDGGAEGIRTPDPHNAIVVLYQLSYDPNRFREFNWHAPIVKAFGRPKVFPLVSKNGYRGFAVETRETKWETNLFPGPKSRLLLAKRSGARNERSDICASERPAFRFLVRSPAPIVDP